VDFVNVIYFVASASAFVWKMHSYELNMAVMMVMIDQLLWNLKLDFRQFQILLSHTNYGNNDDNEFGRPS
jgi:hypothetical protein